MIESYPNGGQDNFKRQIHNVYENKRFLTLAMGVGEIRSLEGRSSERIGHRGTQDAFDDVAPFEGRIGVAAEWWQRCISGVNITINFVMSSPSALVVTSTTRRRWRKTTNFSPTVVWQHRCGNAIWLLFGVC